MSEKFKQSILEESRSEAEKTRRQIDQLRLSLEKAESELAYNRDEMDLLKQDLEGKLLE